MRKPLFHPEAKSEYVNAAGWYRERSPRAAERFEAEVERVLELVVADPESFPHYDETRQFTLLRRFPYSIVYETSGENVYVIAVAHSSRSPGYWQERK